MSRQYPEKDKDIFSVINTNIVPKIIFCQIFLNGGICVGIADTIAKDYSSSAYGDSDPAETVDLRLIKYPINQKKLYI